MEKIEEQLNSIAFSEVPVGMHQSIMRKINYIRLKPILFVSFFLFVINFAILAWRIDNRLVDAEFSDMMRDFFNGFDWSFDFVKTILDSFFGIISPGIALSFVLNFIGMIYIGNKIRKISGVFVRV